MCVCVWFSFLVSAYDNLLLFFRITELHLSLNSFSKVNIQAKHTSLKSLFFNDNKTSEWKEICKLGSAFQNLEHLVVLQNTFNRFEDKDTSERCFPKLKSLVISECGIQDWEDIDKLNDFPELTDVRLKGIPLLLVSYNNTGIGDVHFSKRN